MPHDGLESVARPEPPAAEESIDALAELFLGEAMRHDERAAPVVGRIGAPSGASSSASAVAPVEAIVLGHLPVLASAWAVQYARTRSERLGRPVCLVRLSADTATVEIVGDPAAREPASSVEEALERAGAVAHGWIVLTELDAARVAGLEGVRAVTVLTGADDAAVVGCYAALKAIVETCRPGLTPELRVAIMGSSEADAHDAQERIERASSRFLDVQLPVVIVPRIGPAPVSTVFRGRCAIDGAGLVERVAHAAQNVPAPEAGVSPARASSLVEATGEHAGAAAPGAALLGTETASSSIAGLAALPMRCPYARDVELAVDAQGGLHAIADGALDGVEQLLITSAWADEHAELLEAADGRIDPGAECVMHLITSDAHRASRLLATEVRVHVRGTDQAGGSWLANGR